MLVARLALERPRAGAAAPRCARAGPAAPRSDRRARSAGRAAPRTAPAHRRRPATATSEARSATRSSLLPRRAGSRCARTPPAQPRAQGGSRPPARRRRGCRPRPRPSTASAHAHRQFIGQWTHGGSVATAPGRSPSSLVRLSEARERSSGRWLEVGMEVEECCGGLPGIRLVWFWIMKFSWSNASLGGAFGGKAVPPGFQAQNRGRRIQSCIADGQPALDPRQRTCRACRLGRLAGA